MWRWAMARERRGEVPPEKDQDRMRPDAAEAGGEESLDKAQKGQSAALKKKRAAAMEVLNNARRTRSRSGNWQA
jgi:hypothetical protein